MSLEHLHTKGYTVINDIFTPEEINLIAEKIVTTQLRQGA